MRLMVTGAGGQVGWELRRKLAALGEVIALDRSQCDLSQPDRLPDIVRSVRPDVILNAAAYTAVDDAEREEALATLVNGAAPGVLAREAAKTGALMVHYSTDYVFDGLKEAPYTEDDLPCPLNAYGRSKLAGEAAVKEAGGDWLILRTSWVYGVRGKNFLRTMLALLAERDEVRVVADQTGAPTWSREIAAATAALVEAARYERAEGRFASGVFHMTAAGTTTWHGFAAAIATGAVRAGMMEAGRTAKLIPVGSGDYVRPALRPKNSRMHGGRMRARFGVALGAWEEALGSCLETMREKVEA